MIDDKPIVAGTRPTQLNAVHADPVPPPDTDQPLEGRARIPCACCGRPFQPTVRRRRLCAPCFKSGEGRAGNIVIP